MRVGTLTRVHPGRSNVVKLSIAVACGAMACGLFLAGCSSGKEVTRIDTDEVVDLSGLWNDVDSQLVSQEMVDQVLDHPWAANFQAINNQRPAVIVGTVRNRTSEHIDTKIFTKDIEKALINSGRVRLVAARDERGEIRDERQQQQDWSDPATVSRMGRELGANFMMIGSISSIVDQEGGEQIVFYQTDLELVNIETNEKVWIGDKKIKKYIGRSGYKS